MYLALDLLQSGLDPHQVVLHDYLSEERQYTKTSLLVIRWFQKAYSM